MQGTLARRFFVLVLLTAAVVAIAPSAASAWCGSGAPAEDVQPDIFGGPQWHVVYAIPSDGVDRFATAAPAIVTDLAAVDTWWRGQDPLRTPRFDFADFQGCGEDFGRLDLSFVRLPHDSDHYLATNTRGSRLSIDLWTRTKLSDPRKKYLVYYDGPAAPNICGQSTLSPAGGTYSFVFLGAADSDCGFFGLGLDGYRSATAAHEMTHAMGFLPGSGPPHACPDNTAHSCDSSTDLMNTGRSVVLGGTVLDVGRDDYYRHGGAWSDLADSVWLRHLELPEQQLTIRVNGGGRVTSQTSVGADCEAACSAAWDGGTVVTLRARANLGWRFIGWRGDCSGIVDCELPPARARTVIAEFGPQTIALSMTVAGRGRVVVVAGPTCQRSCRVAVAAGQIALHAQPAAGWRLAGWSGACRGALPACVANGDADAAVTARFARG